MLKTNKSLLSLTSVIEHLKLTYPDMTMRQFRIMLEITQEAGQTQFHYARRCQESEALVSRTVSKLGNDLNLIRIGTRPDGRSKALFISESGQKLLEVLYENFTK